MYKETKTMPSVENLSNLHHLVNDTALHKSKMISKNFISKNINFIEEKKEMVKLMLPVNPF